MNTVVLFSLLMVLLLYVVVIHNGLLKLRHANERAWSAIDVLLALRQDELPRFLDALSHYPAFDAAAVERLKNARSDAQDARLRNDVGAVGRAESVVRTALAALVTTAEGDPELRANPVVQQLLGRIEVLEDALALRRAQYNECVERYNTRIGVFPDVAVAVPFGFHAAVALEFADPVA